MGAAGPQRGDVVLYRGRSPFALAVRLVTGSPWTHAAWCLGGGEILDARWPGGVDVRPLASLACRRRRVVRLPVSAEPALLAALGQLGRSYDFRLMWGLALRAVRRRRRAPRDEADAWICSELVARPLAEEVGWRFDDALPVGAVVPGTIFLASVTGRVAVVPEPAPRPGTVIDSPPDERCARCGHEFAAGEGRYVDGRGGPICLECHLSERRGRRRGRGRGL